jgi:hypothetical protein
MIRQGGFEKGQPCNYTIWTTDPAPAIDFVPEVSTIKGTATVEIQCKKNDTDPTFYQVTDLLIDFEAFFDAWIEEEEMLFMNFTAIDINIVDA